MHRFLTVATVLVLFRTIASVLVLAALLATGRLPIAAQDASPAAGVELAPGVIAEVFAGAPSARAPGQTVYLARFTFQPGSEIFPHSHPGTVLLTVDQSTFGWTLVEGTAQVVRGAAAGATGPTEEVTESGTEVLLNPGDAIFYEDDVVHSARGAGDQPAVVLGTLVLESGQPLLMPAEEMAGMDQEATPSSAVESPRRRGSV